jgi:hypothetical protein
MIELGPAARRRAEGEIGDRIVALDRQRCRIRRPRLCRERCTRNQKTKRLNGIPPR